MISSWGREAFLGTESGIVAKDCGAEMDVRIAYRWLVVVDDVLECYLEETCRMLDDYISVSSDLYSGHLFVQSMHLEQHLQLLILNMEGVDS